MLREIIRYEMSMGNSHECLDCGAVFLAHSDGCPDCGMSARTKLLNEDYFDGEISDEELVGWYFFEDGCLHYVYVGESSPWPRSLKKE